MRRSGPAIGKSDGSNVARRVGRLARALLASYELHLEPVTVDDAEQAAAIWSQGSGLSLAYRLCLALAQRLEATVWTADNPWGAGEAVRQIR
ncbi:MAG: ribonuclease VapC [Actinomycetota bacterium]|nr:ribonuclease VapC [Actinomycetota bacterium]